MRWVRRSRRQSHSPRARQRSSAPCRPETCRRQRRPWSVLPPTSPTASSMARPGCRWPCQHRRQGDSGDGRGSRRRHSCASAAVSGHGGNTGHRAGYRYARRYARRRHRSRVGELRSHTASAGNCPLGRRRYPDRAARYKRGALKCRRQIFVERVLSRFSHAARHPPVRLRFAQRHRGRRWRRLRLRCDPAHETAARRSATCGAHQSAGR